MKTVLFMLLTLCATAHASTYTLCSGVTSTGGKTPWVRGSAQPPFTFWAEETVTSGSGTFAVTVECNFGGNQWNSVGTMSATDTAPDSITVSSLKYTQCRCNVTSITGTGASGNSYVGN